MQRVWRVTIKYVNIRVMYTLNKVVHSRTWSTIIVTDRYRCKNGLYVECGVQILSHLYRSVTIIFDQVLE